MVHARAHHGILLALRRRRRWTVIRGAATTRGDDGYDWSLTCASSITIRSPGGVSGPYPTNMLPGRSRTTDIPTWRTHGTRAPDRTCVSPCCNCQCARVAQLRREISLGRGVEARERPRSGVEGWANSLAKTRRSVAAGFLSACFDRVSDASLPSLLLQTAVARALLHHCPNCCRVAAVPVVPHIDCMGSQEASGGGGGGGWGFYRLVVVRRGAHVAHLEHDMQQMRHRPASSRLHVRRLGTGG